MLLGREDCQRKLYQHAVTRWTTQWERPHHRKARNQRVRSPISPQRENQHSDREEKYGRNESSLLLQVAPSGSPATPGQW